jgi:hypothetical protein
MDGTPTIDAGEIVLPHVPRDWGSVGTHEQGSETQRGSGLGLGPGFGWRSETQQARPRVLILARVLIWGPETAARRT